MFEPGVCAWQAAIFSAGLGVAMMLAAEEVAAGSMSVGDVVMVQGLIFQVRRRTSLRPGRTGVRWATSRTVDARAVHC